MQTSRRKKKKGQGFESSPKFRSLPGRLSKKRNARDFDGREKGKKGHVERVDDKCDDKKIKVMGTDQLSDREKKKPMKKQQASIEWYDKGVCGLREEGSENCSSAKKGKKQKPSSAARTQI